LSARTTQGVALISCTGHSASNPSIKSSTTPKEVL
jgi:hypothetical protein